MVFCFLCIFSRLRLHRAAYFVTTLQRKKWYVQLNFSVRTGVRAQERQILVVTACKTRLDIWNTHQIVPCDESKLTRGSPRLLRARFFPLCPKNPPAGQPPFPFSTVPPPRFFFFLYFVCFQARISWTLRGLRVHPIFPPVLATLTFIAYLGWLSPPPCRLSSTFPKNNRKY